MSKRAEYIRTHYALETIVDASQVVGYRAIAYKLDGRTVDSTIEGSRKGEVCREARCQWGHFNFKDEAEAFGEIFR